jgi:hypothetical protein
MAIVLFQIPKWTTDILRARLSVNQGICGQNLDQCHVYFFIGHDTFRFKVEG